jgi:membrane protease YdiL (CAAX protease family)
MQNSVNQAPIPVPKIIAVLVGFPIIATLLSLLLINRTLITDWGLDFFNTFWSIIIIWYVVQIFIVSKIIKASGWRWNDIGFTLSIKKTIYLILGFLILAFGLLFFIEAALANGAVDSEKLQSLSSLTPKTTFSRVIFIFMALVAGLSEEIVYRGFAIRALESHNINKWFAVILASIPFIFQHGLKSIDQFWWFLITGIFFGILFVARKKLTLNIIIHWLIILSAMAAVLQILE